MPTRRPATRQTRPSRGGDGGRASPARPSAPSGEAAGPVPGPVEPSGRARPAGPAGALSEAVAQVGDRWSLLVVDALLGGPRRFGDLLEQIDGLAPNILSRRLKQLEADGLVVAEPYSRRPLRHSYRLTAPGEELAGVLRLLAQWAAARRGASPGGPAAVGLAHEACGTALEAQWYCPTCGVVVEGDHASELTWL
jgi:DNA-binding HxlR family transcriptional regulator